MNDNSHDALLSGHEIELAPLARNRGRIVDAWQVFLGSYKLQRFGRNVEMRMGHWDCGLDDGF
jgi:hypothetical protein